MDWSLSITCSISTICVTALALYLIKRIFDKYDNASTYKQAKELEAMRKVNEKDLLAEKAKLFSSENQHIEIEGLKIKLDSVAKKVDGLNGTKAEQDLRVANAKIEVFEKIMK